MINIKYIYFLPLILLTGCNSSYIRIVDLDQETMQCRSGSNMQQAFVYPTAEFGVCMDKKLANYLYCVNTISLIKVSSTDSNENVINAGKINNLFDSINFTGTEKKEIIQNMAGEGKLAAARADAINFCKEFTKL